MCIFCMFLFLGFLFLLIFSIRLFPWTVGRISDLTSIISLPLTGLPKNQILQLAALIHLVTQIRCILPEYLGRLLLIKTEPVDIVLQLLPGGKVEFLLLQGVVSPELPIDHLRVVRSQ